MPQKILVIDDDENTLWLVGTLLQHHDFEVIKTTSANEGLDLARDQKPDLVLLDVMMPDMDGWEVYQSMKAQDSMKNIPVIIITAKAQSIDRVLGLHIAKVDDYITKPFSPSELLTSVRKVIANAQSA